MTVNTDIQYRGNCQVCGRFQAVVKGKSSKHGYTVKEGWFSGICFGQNAAPMQHDTKVTGEIVATIRRDCLRLDALAISYETGAITPRIHSVATAQAAAHAVGAVQALGASRTPGVGGLLDAPTRRNRPPLC